MKRLALGALLALMVMPLSLAGPPPVTGATLSPASVSGNGPVLAKPAKYVVRRAQQSGLLQPGDVVYLGAFRLPEGGERPRTFAYGGAAMAYNPHGDPNGPADGFPGSLYVMGHDRMPYGELPNGNQITQVSIPAPVIARHAGDLNRAGLGQGYREALRGLFDAFDELPRAGMLFLDHAVSGPRLHIAMGQHFQDDAPANGPTHAALNPNLSGAGSQGPWYLGDHSLYSVNGYLMEIPAAWADAYAGGRVIGAGRYRDGGWSGQGPALFAYRPWLDDGSTPPAGARLDAVPLLLYENSRNSEDVLNASLRGYQHADEWEGGAWVTSTTGKNAVLFAGTKGTGDKYWYGWAHPGGAHLPCIETEFLGQFPICRLADGSPCPPQDLRGCSDHNDFRGWWSTRWDAQFLLYDPADLARVATGEWQPWQPQPYAVVDIDQYLLLNPDGVEPEMLGTGDQRKYRIGDVAYDRARDLLYVLELFADEASPVIHVFRVR